MYKLLIRPILFLFDPEKVHYFVFNTLRWICFIPGARAMLHGIYSVRDPRLERKLLGLTFANPVGLAAGFDKNAVCIDELDALGFGFIEIGTVTPKPQPGNDKPRLFRLPEDRALINRMGFNNEGAEAAAARLKKRKSKLIIGGNIGKNKATPNEEAVHDYALCVNALNPYVDYFVVNVSSPNTPGLRALQEKGPLKELLSVVKTITRAEAQVRPVLLKIAPDLSQEQLNDIVEVLRDTGTDGIIATNTTISRERLRTDSSVLSRIGAGGLSGEPLKDPSNEVIRYLRARLGPDFPIIGVGGIMTPSDAREKMAAGADLVQIYTGFVYEGPGFAKRICRTLLKK